MALKRFKFIYLIIAIFLLGLNACRDEATPVPTSTTALDPTATTYTITANSITDGGQISPSSLSVSHGESATFQVTSSPGYLLGSIEGCPGVVEGNRYTIESVMSDCDLDVSFSPAVITYKTVLVEESIWEYRTSERMPDYEYAGEQYEGGVVIFNASGFIVADMWQDGFLDVFVPFVKGQASGVDTRFPPLLFKNDGFRFQEASDELIGGMPANPGLRRTVVISDPADGFEGIFGIGHDWGNGNAADAILLAAGAAPEDVTDALPQLPLTDSFGRANAVDAHSMAGGDLNGDGMTDFIVGEFSWLDSPYKLIQVKPGNWEVVEDPFLASLAYEHPMENSEAGNGNNLLLDLHLADVDGDSFDDLIVGWGHGSTKSYVYINDGTGGFSNDDRKALPVSIYGVDNSLHMSTWSFDANGDGHLDLLINYSRFVPYYGGYYFQLLLNDGTGEFTDHTAVGFQNLEGKDRSIGGRLEWSDNFYLIDINHDGLVDIVGSDNAGVRLWIHEPGPVFREVPVDTYSEHRGSTHIFVDMGNGVISSLVFRQEPNPEGTETRIWFDQVDLVMEILPIPTPVPTLSAEQFDEGDVIYSDDFASGWFLNSWDNGTAEPFSSANVYQGSNAIEFTFGPGGGFSFAIGSFDASAYDYLVFYINGAVTADQELYLWMYSEDGDLLGEGFYLSEGYIEGGSLQPGQWHQVVLPLDLVNLEGNFISWFDFGDASGNGASTFFIDEMRFVTAGP